MTAIDWTVQLDADPDTAGLFVLDVSALDGSDVLAADERWITIPPERVISTAIRRGGSEGNRAYDAGECVVELDNRSGDFDPDNPSGFYVTNTPDPERLLTQGTGLRVIANASADATLYTGHIEEPRIGGHWAHPTAVFTATDILADLGGIDVPAQGGQTGPGVSSEVRAHWLLDQAGIPADKRSVQASGRLLLATTGGGPVRTALERVASGEAGRFYVSRDGLVILTWHDAEFVKTSKADFINVGDGPMYVRVETSPGMVGLINQATVHRIVPQVRNEETGQFEDGLDLPDVGAEDSTSVGQYGPRPSPAVDVFLQELADVESLATFLATRRSRPTPRLILLEPAPLETMTAAQAQAILGIDLGDVVTLVQHTIDGRVNEWGANIENIRIDRSSPLTHVVFVTSPSDTGSLFGGPGWFTLDVSALDGPDVLAPF